MHVCLCVHQLRGPPRRPPPHIQEQLKSLNQSLRLGHLLCRSRNPDFLLNIIQRQVSCHDVKFISDRVFIGALFLKRLQFSFAILMRLGKKDEYLTSGLQFSAVNCIRQF